MKRLFLDTNILLDLAQHRENYDFAVKILDEAYNGKIEVCASTLSYANIAYILRKEPPMLIYRILGMLSEDIDMLPLLPNHISAAINQPAPDFEDMLQYQCAKSEGCDIIITNNKKDFESISSLPLMTSQEFISTFNSEN